jgi:hypothetical protein
MEKVYRHLEEAGDLRKLRSDSTDGKHEHSLSTSFHLNRTAPLCMCGLFLQATGFQFFVTCLNTLPGARLRV